MQTFAFVLMLHTSATYHPCVIARLHEQPWNINIPINVLLISEMDWGLKEEERETLENNLKEETIKQKSEKQIDQIWQKLETKSYILFLWFQEPC